MSARYAIAEWFGRPFKHLPVAERQDLAHSALKLAPAPVCPFQRGMPVCSKQGGVCSIVSGDRPPVITCPSRFGEADLLPMWLARIAGFPEVYLAPEVPFMRSPTTGRPAGRVDLVIACDDGASSWFGLEIQAVYFSGKGMTADFELLRYNTEKRRRSPQPVAAPIGVHPALNGLCRNFR